MATLSEKTPLTSAPSRPQPPPQQTPANVPPFLARLLPASFIPYIQLARFWPPPCILLILLPHLFGLLHAAVLGNSPYPAQTPFFTLPPASLLKAFLLLVAGNFFYSNAAHIWNDAIDAPLDVQMPRTAGRPIPRGAVSHRAAMIFTASQAIGAAGVLALFPNPVQAAIGVVPSVVLATYYPFAKRHTYWPQAILGICLALGIVVGEMAAGIDLRWFLSRENIFGAANGIEAGLGMLCLVLACTMWAVMNDTIYAVQDLQDDLRVGVKSTAVLFGDRTRQFLWWLWAVLVLAMLASGFLSDFGAGWYVVACGGSAWALGNMVHKVDLRDAKSCSWWFRNGFWYAGGAIMGGLLMEYMYALWRCREVASIHQLG